MAEIFLMEDSRSLRRILTNQLRDAGHNVTSFEDGVASANSDLLANADVLVTDIAMPVVGGREAISNVRQRFPDLPIIAITGELRESLDQLDVFGRLRKPFSENELLETVNRALYAGGRGVIERRSKPAVIPDLEACEYFENTDVLAYDEVKAAHEPVVEPPRSNYRRRRTDQ